MSEKTVSSRPRHHRGSLVGPVILIGIGLFFLLSNMGLVAWNFWDAAARLWPIILIAIGLDLLIGRRSAVGSLFVLITILLLGAGLFWLNWQTGNRGAITDHVSQSMAGAGSADVTIDFGVGGLRLDALPAESALLLDGSLTRPGRGERVEEDFQVRNGVATYHLKSYGPSSSFSLLSRSHDDWIWNLQLNPEAPMSLAVNTGVGESELDLRALNLTKLHIRTGVGKTTVTLPGHGRLPATIEGGVGELIVLIPAGVAARIEVSTGLGSSQVLGDYERDGNVYTSPGYATAADRLDLQLKAGIGQVTVRSYGGR
jgi:hypothetical protein